MSGLSLVESIAALAIASVLVSSALGHARTSFSFVGMLERENAMLTAARELLERERGAPCSPRAPCPQGFDCRLVRTALGSELGGLDRLEASVRPITQTDVGASNNGWSGGAPSNGVPARTVVLSHIAPGACE